jgi:hypothetical protein
MLRRMEYQVGVNSVLVFVNTITKMDHTVNRMFSSRASKWVEESEGIIAA